jgi:hypothetical protein
MTDHLENVTGTTITGPDGKSVEVRFARSVTIWRAAKLRDIAEDMVRKGEEPVGLY